MRFHHHLHEEGSKCEYAPVTSRLVWWCKSVWILQLFWSPSSRWWSSAVRLLRGAISAVAFWEFLFSAGAEKFCPHCNGAGTGWRQMAFNGTFKHTVKQNSDTRHPSSCPFPLLLLLDNPICSSSPTVPLPQLLSFLSTSPQVCGLSWWGWLPCIHTAPWDKPSSCLYACSLQDLLTADHLNGDIWRG